MEIYNDLQFHNGRGFSMHNHEILVTKLNTRVTFDVLTKFLDHENLELHGPQQNLWIGQHLHVQCATSN